MDDLTKFADYFFDSQRLLARHLADWIIRQIEKPVKLLARPKHDMIDTEIEQARYRAEHPLPND